MFEEIPVFDEGTESEPAVSEVKADEAQSVTEPVTASGEDSAEETKDESAAASENTDESEGAKVSETEEKEEVETESLLASVDKEIADEKHPKWFREKLKSVKTAFLNETDTVKSAYEPLKDFGNVERIVEDLSILKGLDSFENDPATNLPKPTVKPFVDKLLEAKGEDTMLMLVKDLVERPSPFNDGRKIYHDIIESFGLDPTRIEDFKRFQANGYQTANDGFIPPDQEDLQTIPENLREAFSSLTPEKRDSVILMDDEVMQEYLEGVQMRLDTARKEKENEVSEAQKQVEEKQQAEREFYTKVAAKESELIDSSGTKLFDSFTESLVSTGLNEIEALSISNLMSMTLNSQGVEAKRNIAALESIGVKVDASLMDAFGGWMESARAMATFELQGNEQQFKAAKERFEAFEEKLIRKSNPIVAAVGKNFAQREKAISEQKDTLLTELTTNNGLNANDGTAAAISNGNTSVGDWRDMPVFSQ